MSNQKANQPKQTEIAEESRKIVVRANYEFFVFSLLLLQLSNSFLVLLVRDEQSVQIPTFISLGVSMFLIIDAIYRVVKAGSLRRGLLDLNGYLLFIGALPIPFFVIARFIWYRLMTRRLRRNDYAQMERIISKQSAQTALLAVILTAILVMEIGSIFILQTEAQAANANIRSAGDALWWSLVTMATVGYGDLYPVTVHGRLVAVFVMLIGVGLFTIMTSYFAQRFMRPRSLRSTLPWHGDETTPTIQGRIHQISSLIDQQEEVHQQSIHELREQLAELERMIKGE